MSRLTKVSIDSVLYDIGNKGINSYETLSEMLAEPISNLYEGAICWVNQEETYFQWRSSNEIISNYGRYRELEFGSDFQVSDTSELDANSDEYRNKVIQYIGETKDGFKKGCFYESTKANSVEYLVAEVDSETSGTFYILEDDGVTYTPITLLGDGNDPNYDENQTYYKQQTVDIYTWKYLGIFDGYATDVKYKNADYPDLTDVGLAIDKILAKIYYVNPSITSFIMTPATTEYEIGTTIPSNTLTFTWAVNKEITSQSLTGCNIELEDREAIFGEDLSSTKSFVLSISDGENSASASKKISFLYPIYYGCCAEGEYNNDFILELENKKLTASNKMSYNFNCGSGEYAYFATPTSMKVLSAWVNGFQADIEEVAVVSHTNASGHVSSYTISRFSNSGLGSFVAEVK